MRSCLVPAGVDAREREGRKGKSKRVPRCRHPFYRAQAPQQRRLKISYWLNNHADSHSKHHPGDEAKAGLLLLITLPSSSTLSVAWSTLGTRGESVFDACLHRHLFMPLHVTVYDLCSSAAFQGEDCLAVRAPEPTNNDHNNEALAIRDSRTGIVSSRVSIPWWRLIYRDNSLPMQLVPGDQSAPFVANINEARNVREREKERGGLINAKKMPAPDTDGDDPHHLASSTTMDATGNLVGI